MGKGCFPGSRGSGLWSWCCHYWCSSVQEASAPGTLSNTFQMLSNVPGIAPSPSHALHNVTLLADLPDRCYHPVTQIKNPGLREVKYFVQKAPTTKEVIPSQAYLTRSLRSKAPSLQSCAPSQKHQHLWGACQKMQTLRPHLSPTKPALHPDKIPGWVPCMVKLERPWSDLHAVSDS